MFGIDLLGIITAIGYFGIAISITVEAGLFFGFLLPGDSLLFTVGLLASQGIFDLRILLPLVIFCAIFGESAGYWVGKKFGPRLFTKEESFFFKPKYMHLANEFFLKYGPAAIFLGRFTPVIRSIIPIVAGIAHMPYRPFLVYNILGGVVWAGGMTLLGYYLGSTFPLVQDYLAWVLLAIVIITFIPAGIHFFNKWRAERSGKKPEEPSPGI